MAHITKEDFFSRYYVSIIPGSKEDARMTGVFETMVDAVSELNPENEYSSEFFEQYFHENFMFNSRVVFATYRGVMLHIMEEEHFNPKTVENLSNVNFMNVLQLSSAELEYWGSLDSLREALNEIEVLSGHETNYQKTVCDLLWYGMKMSQMADLTLDDIDSEHMRIRIGENAVTVDPETMWDLSRHIQSRRYNSVYVFIGHHGAKSSDATIRKNLVWLSEFETKIEKVFDARKIWLSGKFERVYLELEDEPRYNLDMMAKYENWKETYKA